MYASFIFVYRQGILHTQPTYGFHVEQLVVYCRGLLMTHTSRMSSLPSQVYEAYNVRHEQFETSIVMQERKHAGEVTKWVVISTICFFYCMSVMEA